ncbi:hypothetical protein M426DRAFT_21619 [Hypoxylon sp. CI-4A]|nr:hypothetical protein M426DRAFT_21619 [Hypoxylon sp. CI-4A]
MRTGTQLSALVVMSFASLATAEKGAATVHGCIWHSSKPVKAYNVQWTAGSSGDKCMRLVGSNIGMEVSHEGITCKSLGKVAVDASGWCYFRQSLWGMAYVATGAAYLGLTFS